jgi:hypothetical protein
MPLPLKIIGVQIQSNSSTCSLFPQYWEKAKFPFHVIPKLGALHIAGGTIKVIYLLFFSSFASTPTPSFNPVFAFPEV